MPPTAAPTPPKRAPSPSHDLPITPTPHPPPRTPVPAPQRRHIESAAAEGIAAVHVRWGYGGPAESAGAVASVTAPAHLIDLLDSVAHDRAE